MTLTSAAETYHWDTVSAVRGDTINDAIKSAGTTPPGFRQPSLEDGKEIVVNGG